MIDKLQLTAADAGQWRGELWSALQDACQRGAGEECEPHCHTTGQHCRQSIPGWEMWQTRRALIAHVGGMWCEVSREGMSKLAR